MKIMCILCREFVEAPTPKTKYCPDCKIIAHKKQKSVWKINHKKINHRKLKTCIVCKKIFDSPMGRLYCSGSCRTKKWNLYNLIKGKRKTIETKTRELEELEMLYDSLQ